MIISEEAYKKIVSQTKKLEAEYHYDARFTDIDKITFSEIKQVIDEKSKNKEN